MSTIDTSLAILIILSVVAVLVLGVTIFAVVEVAQFHARRVRGLRSHLPARDTPRVAATDSREDPQAERLRVAIRQNVALTRDAVERAASRGMPVGDLRQVVVEIARHATRLDEQLGMVARQTSLRPDTALLTRLTDHHDKLTDVCTRIRSDLVDAELRQSTAELGETLRRAQIEVETLRAVNDEIGSSLDEKIAEIDELYRRQVTDRPESPER